MIVCSTGKEKDAETNLDYFGARYLDKDFGIWLTPDPAREFPNSYAYMGNVRNPLNAVDKTGNITFDIRKIKTGYDVDASRLKDYSRIDVLLDGRPLFSREIPNYIQKG
jgi:RHS repeat-associated protein